MSEEGRAFLDKAFQVKITPTVSRGDRSPVLAEQEASSTEVPEDEGVELRRTADGKGDGVWVTRPFAAGETVMVGFLVASLTGNDAHATQVGPGRWARHGGLGPMINHSCDPTVWLDGAFSLVARKALLAGDEITVDYATFSTVPASSMRCRCGARRCRGVVTGNDWRLPELYDDYGDRWSAHARRLIASLRA